MRRKTYTITEVVTYEFPVWVFGDSDPLPTDDQRNECFVVFASDGEPTEQQIEDAWVQQENIDQYFVSCDERTIEDDNDDA